MKDLWLNSKDIQRMSAELLTKEYIIRLDQWLEHIYTTYVSVNGLEIFDEIINVLESYQNHIDNIIKNESREVAPGVEDAENYRQWLKNSLREPVFNPFVDNDSLRVDLDVLNNKRRSEPILRYLIYGNVLEGVRGNITWEEINDVKEKVINFKESKGQINKEDSNSNNENISGEVKNVIIQDKESLNIANDITKYLSLLKTVECGDKTYQVINEVGEFVNRYKHKSIIIAWVDVLKEKGLISSSINIKDTISLLNKLIKNLNMSSDVSLFGKETTTMTEFKGVFRKIIK